MAGHGPPPPEYVGTWEAEDEKLEIEPNGSIWDQRKGHGERGSFLRTDGATLVVAFVASGDREFNVGSAPHRDPDSKWRMTLDGVQFVRTK